MSQTSNTPHSLFNQPPLSSLAPTQLLERLLLAERALREIATCDFRGHEPAEQMIARHALKQIERVR